MSQPDPSGPPAPPDAPAPRHPIDEAADRPQAGPQAPAGRRRRDLALGATGVLGVGLLAGAWLLRPTAPATATATSSSAGSVTITVSARPAAARLTLDGEPLACNPCPLARPAGSHHLLTASAPGFSTQQLDLPFDHDRNLAVMLFPYTVAPLAPPSPAPLRRLRTRTAPLPPGGPAPAPLGSDSQAPGR